MRADVIIAILLMGVASYLGRAGGYLIIALPGRKLTSVRNAA
jgi:uncharacterized membrane protein